MPRTPAPRPEKDSYDVVVVGARVAGAATAMLLARAGLDVLVVDRAAAGSDTLSSHALMRGAVSQLARWDLLDRVKATTPRITTTTFVYGRESVTIEIAPDGDVDGLYAPRRTVLDPIMVAAAREAGAEVRHDTPVVDLIRRDDGRVAGVVLAEEERRRAIGADLVIGADGLHSPVARRLDVPVVRSGGAALGAVMTYVRGTTLPDDGYLWINQPGIMGGVIPTNDDLRAVFVSIPPQRFAELRRELRAHYPRLVEELSPELAAQIDAAEQVGPLRSWPGHVGQFRQACGAGWALVGDAGYFKDPAAAHGISDAFRDAELLANAVLAGDLGAFGHQRDHFSAELFESLERIVDLSWTLDDLPARHRAMATAMRREHDAVVDHWAAEVAPMVA